MRARYAAAATAVAGFTDISVTFTHAVADRMYSAIIRAAKPPADLHPRTG